MVTSPSKIRSISITSGTEQRQHCRLDQSGMCTVQYLTVYEGGYVLENSHSPDDDDLLQADKICECRLPTLADNDSSYHK